MVQCLYKKDPITATACNISGKHIFKRKLDMNTNNSDIQTVFVNTGVKFEYNGLLTVKKESCDVEILKKELIGEISSQESRSIQSCTDEFVDSRNSVNIKLENDDLSIEKTQNNDIELVPENEEIGEDFRETVNKRKRDEEPNSSNEHGRFECDQCDQKFSTSRFLEHHIKFVHNDSSSKRLSCEFCDYKTNFCYDLKIHVDAVHFKLKKFECHLCDYESSQKCNLKFHIDSVHLNLKKYQCEFCDHKATKKHSLKKHVESIHLNLKKFSCDLCDFRANLKGCLKIHVDSVHLKLRKYKCHLCDYGAFRQCDLKLHVDSVHLDLKKFQCHLCDFRETRNSRLQIHISKKHRKLKK